MFFALGDNSCSARERERWGGGGVGLFPVSYYLFWRGFVVVVLFLGDRLCFWFDRCHGNDRLRCCPSAASVN